MKSRKVDPRTYLPSIRNTNPLAGCRAYSIGNPDSYFASSPMRWR